MIKSTEQNILCNTTGMCPKNAWPAKWFPFLPRHPYHGQVISIFKAQFHCKLDLCANHVLVSLICAKKAFLLPIVRNYISIFSSKGSGFQSAGVPVYAHFQVCPVQLSNNLCWRLWKIRTQNMIVFYLFSFSPRFQFVYFSIIVQL